MTIRIALLMGGLSSEREISLKSGEAVYKALLEAGYEVDKIDVDKQVAKKLLEKRYDLAFIMLHGAYGEDGTIQGLLEILGIPYTGSGVLASAIAMDKIMSKKVLMQAGLPTAPFVSVSRYHWEKNRQEVLGKIKNEISLPLVVKAPNQGSTIGIYFVWQEDELENALEEAFKFPEREILIEKFIKGKEVTAPVLGNNEVTSLPLIQIISKTGVVYDYQAKYTAGLSEHVIPPELPKSVIEKVQDLACQAHLAIGCSGLSRVDFIIDDNFQPYILEVNTIPGMTETSLFPDSARAIGWSYKDLCCKIIEYAGERFNKKFTLVNNL